MDQAENLQVRQYLLGKVIGEAAEEIEFRLLTDREYADEFNIIVNQITDEYVNGVFQGEELERVEKFFFKTPQRREKLSFTLALKRAQGEHEEPEAPLKLVPKPQSRQPLKVYLPVAAGVLLALTLGVTLWKSFRSSSEINEALVALNAAYPNQRPTESRISGFTYAPFSTTRRPEDQSVNEAELRRAELTLLAALSKRPTPAVHHALGQVYLAKRQLDDAIKQFDESLKGENN